MKLCLKYILLFSFILIGSSAFSANRYWVSSGAGNWNNTANWSTNSNSAGGASVPGSSDIAIFDGAGSNNGNCTIDAAVNVAGLSISGYTGTISQGANTIAIGTSHFSMSSGTFTGGSSSITLSGGTFTLTGGTFTSTSGTLSIGGSYCAHLTIFTHSSGVFNHNNGTINFNSSNCGGYWYTIDVLTTTQFYDLTVANGNGSYTQTAAGDTLDVQHNLTHNDSYIYGLLELKNNLTIGTNADGGQGKIIFKGTGAQTYSFTSGTARTCHLWIEKTAGSVAPAGGTTDLSVQALTLVSSSFTAPTGTLSIGGSWCAHVTIFTHSGGTFNNNNGLVYFDPSNCGGYWYTIDVLTSTQFYDVTVASGNGSYTYVTAGDTLDVQHNLTHNDSYIYGNWELKNNLSIGVNADGGQGKIIFNGTGAQTYSFPTGGSRSCHLWIQKTAGSVAPDGSTTDLSVQALTLISSSFTAPTGTLSIGGSWCAHVTIFTHSGGTFNNNGGLLYIDPSNCGGYWYTLDVLSSTQFNNVTVASGNGSYTQVAAGDTLDVQNNLTHNDSYIYGNWELKNNLIIGANADGGQGKIIFNGTGAQTYSFPAGGSRTCHLWIQKTAGSVAPDGSTTDLSVQALTLISSSFTAPTGTLSIGGSWCAHVTIFTHSGGSFNNNGGLLYIDPSNCGGYWYTLDVLSSTQFNNVTVASGNGSYTQVAAGDTLDIQNNLTHNDSYIYGLWELKNNLIIGTNADGGQGKIIFNGTGAQTYSFPSGGARTAHIWVQKTAGSVAPAVGTTDFSIQALTLISSSFTAPTGTLSIGGGWCSHVTIFTHSGGSFNNSGGLLYIDPSNCGGYWYTIDVLPVTQFYDVTVASGNGSYTYVAAGDTLDVQHNLTHNDSYIYGNWELKNNLIISANADGGQGKIIFNSTTAQTYTFPSGSARTCHLWVQKTAGSVAAAAGTTDLSVQALTIASSTFTAPIGTLKIGGSWCSHVTLFTHSGGSFNNNSGLVYIDPSNCGGYWYTIDVLNYTQFYDVTVASGNGSYTYVAAGDTLDCQHNLTHNDSYIYGNWELKNNLIIDATSDGGQGKIIFNSTTTQTYSFPSGGARTCHIWVQKTAGSVNPEAGTTDLSVQAFTLTAGTFTAPIGTFRIGGGWCAHVTLFTHSGGSFVNSSGLVYIDPTNCGGYWYTFDVIPTTQFYDVTVASGNGSYTQVAANDTLETTHNLIFTDSYMMGIWEARSTVTVQSTFDGGSGTLLFTGTSGNQNFDLTGATDKFDGSIKINKSSGNVVLQSICLMDGASQTLTFMSGNIVSTSTNMLQIGDNVTVSGASNSSYVDGQVRKIGNDAFTFPVGNSGAYAAITITAPSVNTDHFTAEYFKTTPDPTYNKFLKDVTLEHVSRSEYWILNRTNGTSNVSVTLSWQSARSGEVTNLATLRVARWDGSLWRDHGNGGTTGNTTAGTVISSAAVSSFSPFTLASTTTENPLPIELLSFTAQKSGNNVDVKWNTATEVNNDYYSVESSADMNTVETISTVKGAGNSSSTINYSTIDKNPLPGTSYYRLKQTDFDGKYKYYNWVAVEFNERFSFNIFPNPVDPNSGFALNFPNELNNQSVLIKIYDAAGREVFSKLTIPGTNMGQLIAIDPSHTLSSGVYIISATSDNSIYKQKLIIR